LWGETPHEFTPAQIAAFWEHLSHDERFLTTLIDPHDLVFVLRAHLLIETRMNQLLDLRFPDARVLHPKEFMRKMTVLVQSDLITLNTAQKIKALNWLRQQFAHAPLKLIISDDMWKHMRSMLQAPTMTFINTEYLVRHPQDDTPPGKARALAYMIHFGLTQTIRLRYPGYLDGDGNPVTQ
jgi:hypothetical protein